jgi:hypothetical protein
MGRHRKVGFTALVVTPSDTKASILHDLKILLRKTPRGRHCAIIYDLQNHENKANTSNWGTSPLWTEAILVENIIGNASERNNLTNWEFFANLAVRFCQPKKQVRQITSEIGVLIFRKKGEKTYKRRTKISQEINDASTIDALHPVFTRDIANNIWHMKNQKSRYNIVDRLGVLLAWSDERILVSKNSKITTRNRSKGNYSIDLIGVPEKTPYYDAPGLRQQRLL